MKIRPIYKPECAASTDTTRVVINHLKLEGEKLISTDGRRIAVIPIEVAEGDQDGLVSIRALKAAKGERKKKKDDIFLSCNGKLTTILTTIERVSFPRPQGIYPKWKDAMPVKLDTYKIAINPELLLGLAQAIGSPSQVILYMTSHNNVIYVEPFKADNPAYGAMMPMRLDNAIDWPTFPAAAPLKKGESTP